MAGHCRLTVSTTHPLCSFSRCRLWPTCSFRADCVLFYADRQAGFLAAVARAGSHAPSCGCALSRVHSPPPPGQYILALLCSAQHLSAEQRHSCHTDPTLCYPCRCLMISSATLPAITGQVISSSTQLAHRATLTTYGSSPPHGFLGAAVGLYHPEEAMTFPHTQLVLWPHGVRMWGWGSHGCPAESECYGVSWGSGLDGVLGCCDEVR